MLTLLALSSLTPTASADELVLTAPGRWGGPAVAGSADTGIADVSLNGELFTMTMPNPLLPNLRTFSESVWDVSPGLVQHQSAMHSIRASVVNPTAPGLGDERASDQRAYYDQTEIGQRTETNTFRPRAASLRITERGLDEVGVLIHDELRAHAADVAALGPPVEQTHSYTLPVTLCRSLGDMGVHLDAFAISMSDLGWSGIQSDLDPFGIEICATAVGYDWFRDFDDLLEPAGPFLTFDSQPNRVVPTVELGPAALGGGVLVETEITVDPAAWTGFPGPSPTVTAFDVDVPCSGSVSVDGARTQFGLELEPTFLGGLDVHQALDATDAQLLGFELELGGVCGGLGLETPMEGPLEALMEHIVVGLVNNTLPAVDLTGSGEPLIASALAPVLDAVDPSGTIPLGTSTDLDIDARFDEVDEDDDGVTFVLRAKARAVGAEPSVGQVSAQDDFYKADEIAPFVTPGQAYDLEATLSTAWMSQVLYEAYRAGVFHDRWTDRSDLAPLGYTGPSGNLDASGLTALFPGIDLLIPSSTKLLIDLGPRLAPIVVTEDPSAGVDAAVHFSMFDYRIEVKDAATGEIYVTAVADLKIDAQLEVSSTGEIVPVFEQVQFQMNFIDPTGEVYDAVGSGMTLANALLGGIENRMIDELTAPIEGISLPRVELPDGFLTADAAEFTAIDSDTQQQRESLRIDVSF